MFNVVLMLILVYAIMALSLLLAIILSKKIIREDKDASIARHIVINISILIAIMYFIPITGMIISAFTNPIMVYIIGYSMVLITIPNTYLVIVPLLERKKRQYFKLEQ